MSRVSTLIAVSSVSCLCLTLQAGCSGESRDSEVQSSNSGASNADTPKPDEPVEARAMAWLRELPRGNVWLYSSPLPVSTNLRAARFEGMNPDDLRQVVYYDPSEYRIENALRNSSGSDYFKIQITPYFQRTFDEVVDHKARRVKEYPARDVRSVWLYSAPKDPAPLDSFPNLEAMFLWNGSGNHAKPVNELAEYWEEDSAGLARILSSAAAKKLIAIELPAGKPTSDRELAIVGKLDQLQALSLWKADVTDNGMEDLQSLKNLKVLNLDGTSVGDGGIEHLSALPELRSISLNGTRITNASVNSLARFPKLTEIRIWHTAIDEEGIAQIESQAPHIKHVEHNVRSNTRYRNIRGSTIIAIASVVARWAFQD